MWQLSGCMLLYPLFTGQCKCLSFSTHQDPFAYLNVPLDTDEAWEYMLYCMTDSCWKKDGNDRNSNQATVCAHV